MKFRCIFCGQMLECEYEYAGIDIFCPSCNNRLKVPSTQSFTDRELTMRINEKSLRDSKESTAFGLLVVCSLLGIFILFSLIFLSLGLVLFIILALWIGRRISELIALAYIKTNAIEVSSKQFPEIYNIARSFADQLGKQLPSIYVLQNNVWNSFAMKLAGKKVVVLLSGAIDAILLKGSKKQLAWLIGHELGHHFAGHLNFWRRIVSSMGSWFFWIYLWYNRRCELTCDRYGLACAGSLEDSIRAICNMTVGAQLASELNVDEALVQWDLYRSEFFVKYTTIYSTHPNPLWRIEEIKKAARSLGIN